MESSICASTSYLPGKLREAAHAVLRPDEAVHCEFSPSVGSGLLLTSMRIIVVQGGLLRTLKLSGTQSAYLSLTQLRDLALEVRGESDSSGGFLLLSADGVNLPPWVTRIAVDHKALPRAFRFTQLLYAMLGQLGLESPTGQKLPRPRAVCPVCDAPLVQAIERSN
jgi:hypothetical protein